MPQTQNLVFVSTDAAVRTSPHAAALLAIIAAMATDGIVCMTTDAICAQVGKYPDYQSHRRVKSMIKSLTHAGYISPVEKSGKTITCWKIEPCAVVTQEDGDLQ